MSCLCFPFAFCFNSLKGFKRRKDILAKSNEKISEELDVITLLNKLRLGHDLISNLLGKRQKKMLRYQKSSIIDVDESDT
jgi:hypothetical protein